MSKKGLSDLLREEVAKEKDSETEEANPVAAVEPASPWEEAEPPPPATAPASRLTKAQLEGRVAELTVTLEKAGEGEKALQNQINDLESELEAQKDLINSLEAKLEQASLLAGELAAQKTLVEKLEAELAEQKQLVGKLYAELQQVQQQEKLAEISVPELPPKKAFPAAIQPRPIGRSTIPSQPSPALSNEDIGWFD